MTCRRFCLFCTVILLVLASLSGCTMGEVKQTNESLTVTYYGTDNGSTGDLLGHAAALFRKSYPEVKLIIEREPYTSDSEVYFTQLAAEVMRGKGPDLFWIESAYMDPYKMMSAGAFADLTPFMEQDADFTGNAYNQVVLKGGQYKDRQYIVPLNYAVPVLISEKELLDRVGFDYESCTDFRSLWSALAQYAETYQKDPSLPKPLRFMENTRDFPNWTGIPWLDIENRKIDLQTEQWIDLFENYQTIYSTMEESEQNEFYYSLSTPIWMDEGKFLFELCEGSGSYNFITPNLRGISSLGEPVLLPVYDINGGIQAQITDAVGVPRTSPNQQNAYQFIKILLSPECQILTDSFAPENIPLSNEALRQTLRKSEQELEGEWALSSDGPIPDLSAIPPEV